MPEPLDEFDLSQVVGVDDATAREKMDAYRQILAARRGFGMLGALSGDKALGGLGGQLLGSAAHGEDVLSRVPEAQSQYALRKEQTDKLEAARRAREHPLTPQVLTQTLQSYGMSAPEGTPTETLEYLLPLARAAHDAKQGRLERAQRAADADAYRRLLLGKTNDKEAQRDAASRSLGVYFTDALVPLRPDERSSFTGTQAGAGLRVLTTTAKLHGLLGNLDTIPGPTQVQDVQTLASKIITDLNTIAKLGALSAGDRQILDAASGNPADLFSRGLGRDLQAAIKRAADMVRDDVVGTASLFGSEPLPGSPFDPAWWDHQAKQSARYWAGGGKGRDVPQYGLPKAAGRAVAPAPVAPAPGPQAAPAPAPKAAPAPAAATPANTPSGAPVKTKEQYLEEARARRAAAAGKE